MRYLNSGVVVLAALLSASSTEAAWNVVPFDASMFTCAEDGTWDVPGQDRVVYRTNLVGDDTVFYNIKVRWTVTKQCGRHLAFALPEGMTARVETMHAGAGHFFAAPTQHAGKVVTRIDLSCRTSIDRLSIICDSPHLIKVGSHAIWFSASGMYERDTRGQ